MTRLHNEAALDRLGEAYARLMPAFEKHLAFEHLDDAVRERAVWHDVLDRPLPAEGAGLDVVLDELALAVRYGSRLAQPGFNAFITTSGTTASIAAASAVSVAGGQRYLLQAFNTLEHVGLRWLAEVCAVPASWTGVFVSGGSSANIVGLAAARQWAYEQRGLDPAEHGLVGAPRGRVYVSTEAHRTIHRAAAVLGLGRSNVVEIPTDARQRIDTGLLRDALERDRRAGLLPVAVVAIAGTTNTGAIDPLAEVIDIARAYGAWVHVDGAYGLPAAADPDVRPMLAAVADADSAIVDPHKWLATGLGVGAAYVRDGALLHRALQEGDAAYLEGSFGDDVADARSQFDAMGGAWADLGLELSAPPRGPLVWAVLREIGADGLAARVARDRAYAQRVTAAAVDHPRLEAFTEPELSVACFRYVGSGGLGEPALDVANKRILERLRRETPYVPSSTVVDGRFAIRPCYINPRTTLAEVDGLVDAVVRLGDAN